MAAGVGDAETATFHALREASPRAVDGQQVMLEAREIENWGESSC